ncbi:hypothetical protein B0H10DRAFT_1958417 [Mycena sp. CBHHK59/15]|nr:hypothetical protein B0H10DRAFT_1958417 [Mycena sp. CBHHK59/15]
MAFSLFRIPCLTRALFVVRFTTLGTASSEVAYACLLLKLALFAGRQANTRNKTSYNGDDIADVMHQVGLKFAEEDDIIDEEEFYDELDGIVDDQPEVPEREGDEELYEDDLGDPNEGTLKTKARIPYGTIQPAVNITPDLSKLQYGILFCILKEAIASGNVGRSQHLLQCGTINILGGSRSRAIIYKEARQILTGKLLFGLSEDILGILVDAGALVDGLQNQTPGYGFAPQGVNPLAKAEGHPDTQTDIYLFCVVEGEVVVNGGESAESHPESPSQTKEYITQMREVSPSFLNVAHVLWKSHPVLRESHPVSLKLCAPYRKSPNVTEKVTQFLHMMEKSASFKGESQ